MWLMSNILLPMSQKIQNFKHKNPQLNFTIKILNKNNSNIMQTYHPILQYRQAASWGVKACITISKLCRSRILENNDITRSTLYVPNNSVFAREPYSSNIFTIRLKCLLNEKKEGKITRKKENWKLKNE